MQEGVNKAGVGLKVGSDRQIPLHRVVLRQRRENLFDNRNRCVVLAQAHLLECRLEHLNADPPVVRVKHDRRDPVDPKAAR